MNLNAVKNFLLDLVFPRYCLGCRKEIQAGNSLICANCFNKIKINRSVRCHVCGLRSPYGARPPGACRNCRSKTKIKAVMAAGFYGDPILREMIHCFKYNSIESLKKPLSEIAINYLKDSGLAGNFSGFVLVPVPLTLRRKINRGFNQSELLAVEISKYLNLPVINLLKRKKFTAPQAEISDWQKRKENISGVFEVRLRLKSDFGETLKSDFEGFQKIPQKIILVDDVKTSGATLEEAARVLKEAGVKEIYGLVIAEG